MQDVRVIGHRGAANLAPENTLASIRAAAAVGTPWVEIDVSVLADGALVIFHDDELERCSNGQGPLAAANLAYIQQLDAGSWFAHHYAGEPIPTLQQALQCIQELGLGLNLEIKHEGADVERIVPRVLEELQLYWQDNDKLIISSFNHQALLLCHELAPDRYLGQLYEAVPQHWQEQLSALQAYSLHCDYKQLDASTCAAVKAAGYKVLCYTANEPALVEAHWQWGMDAIITDSPQLFLNTDA
ncbi:glycerophosphoryl diester phosphodiesterase [Balneatrix alpica]|uniref:Glycerophosphoryl diester phosphodiesterase n=1 Tax=Balneatrix alpica TaxID=75684 RepID=A0ABV5ZET9_9GAMM|nr:glycerophosphoryl diester phosphodiesterase [Balneatrix alpica]